MNREGKQYNDLISFFDFRPENAYVCEIDGEITASVQLVYRFMRCEGTDFLTGFYYMMSLDASHRGEGLIKHIMSMCESDMRERGVRCSISTMDTGSKRAWRAMGYREAVPMDIYRERLDEDAEDADIEIKRAELSDAAFLPYLDSLYEWKFADYAHIVRAPWDWLTLICKCAVLRGGLLLEFLNGVVVGYCVYRPDRISGEIRILETVSRRSDAALRRAALRYLGVRTAMVTEAINRKNAARCFPTCIINDGGDEAFPYDAGYVNLLHL